jgi:hypothetical protein
MSRVVPAAKKLAIGMAAAAVLSLGVGGLAGAATTAPSSTPSPSTTPKTPALTRFNCDRAPQALARIQKAESRISAGLPRLKAAEQKAKAAGHTKLADRIQHRITRLENPKTTARLDRLSKAIEAKCGASAPASSPSTGAATGPSTASA